MFRVVVALITITLSSTSLTYATESLNEPEPKRSEPLILVISGFEVCSQQCEIEYRACTGFQEQTICRQKWSNCYDVCKANYH
ncbi:hypothetical protein SAMN05216548_114122 [Faunimonas pinastri]|uniref:Uncharacterized protein n=1 Tax=Faunimonas pinastri TaxID=1855383 RepID=A0A1H9MZU9_9HYPH|nr:hypothetical protein SAMN05216548_114122 [Faunimonas pinastri]